MAEKLLKEYLYGDLLAPEEGYATDFAVGMTYSLGFDALLTAYLAFGMLDDVSDDALGMPHLLLDAVSRSSDKVVLFCNKGGIAVPSKVQKVHSLLERNIYEVFDRNDLSANFHPKLWLIREVKKDDADKKQIKLIVTSRNLKFTDTIDCVACLKGEVGDKVHDDKHKPLADFVMDIAECSNIIDDRKEAVRNLVDDLMKVERFEVSGPFEDYDFIPYVFNSRSRFPLGSHDGNIHLQGKCTIVVSPFIDLNVLKKINPRKKKDKYLITRREYVTNDVLEWFTKVFVCDEDVAASGADLHAKMYHIWSNRNNQYLFLGSANATYSAFNRNAEFLLRLKYKYGNINDKEFLSGFYSEGDPDSRFVQMTEDDLIGQDTASATEDVGRLLEKTLKELICDEGLKAVVEPVDGKCYSITVTSTKADSSVYIAPMQRASDVKPWSQTVVFDGLELPELSEFYVVSVTGADGVHIEKVIKIPTDGIPADRDRSIYKGIIRNPKDFYTLLGLMLSDVPYSYLIGRMNDISSEHKASEGNDKIIYTDLYESLLRTAASEPEKIGRIQDLMKRLDEDVVPEEFSRLIAHFVEAIQ